MERGAISGRPLVKSLSVGFIATRNLIARRTMPAFFFPPSIIVPFSAENRHASNLIDLYLEFKRNRLVPNHRLLSSIVDLLDRKSREIGAKKRKKRKKKKDRTRIRATSS